MLLKVPFVILVTYSTNQRGHKLGWDQGIMGMRTGGIRHLRIPARFAYGETGDEERNIPPNATIYLGGPSYVKTGFLSESHSKYRVLACRNIRGLRSHELGAFLMPYLGFSQLSWCDQGVAHLHLQYHSPARGHFRKFPDSLRTCFKCRFMQPPLLYHSLAGGHFRKFPDPLRT